MHDKPRSWLEPLNSSHTKRNFGVAGRRFLFLLGEAGCTLRTATVEDVRQMFEALVAGCAESQARQMILCCKSLLTYGHKLGYLQFNAGALRSRQCTERRKETGAQHIDAVERRFGIDLLDVARDWPPCDHRANGKSDLPRRGTRIATGPAD